MDFSENNSLFLETDKHTSLESSNLYAKDASKRHVSKTLAQQSTAVSNGPNRISNQIFENVISKSSFLKESSCANTNFLKTSSSANTNFPENYDNFKAKRIKHLVSQIDEARSKIYKKKKIMGMMFGLTANLHELINEINLNSNVIKSTLESIRLKFYETNQNQFAEPIMLIKEINGNLKTDDNELSIVHKYNSAPNSPEQKLRMSDEYYAKSSPKKNQDIKSDLEPEVHDETQFYFTESNVIWKQ